MARKARRILFVDDDTQVLRELRRSLLALVDTWDVHFCTNPAEALESLPQLPPFDMVAADIQLPDLGGVDFLAALQESCPATIRFAVIPEIGGRDMMRVTSVAHQFLGKPFEVHVLVSRIERACTVKDRLDDSPLIATLVRVGGIPSAPATYSAIVGEMQTGEPDMEHIAGLIERDAGLSAKMLQVVNSAFVGLRHPVSNIVQAATLLGLERLKNLVLMAEVFQPSEGMSRQLNLDALWNHTLRVSRYAGCIAEAMHHEDAEGPDVRQEAATAGLLHEIGHIMMAAYLPEQYDEALELARREDLSLLAAEKRLFGATHSAVGGYLLDLWGLPLPVVEAVTYYDYPSGLPENRYDPDDFKQFSALGALHVAYYFATDAEETDPTRRLQLDTFYLEQTGLLDRVEGWFDACVSA